MARLDANKFETPTPVQAGCIPPALEGRDVLATAQTGTGKTLGYLIPIVEMMQKAEGKGAHCAHPSAHARAGHAGGAGLSLPFAPTPRRPWPWWSAASPSASQLEAIRRGARLIVATPGRLEDYLKRKLVNLDGIKILVLDEVDRMLDMGFQPAIDASPLRCPPCARPSATRLRSKPERTWRASTSRIPSASKSARCSSPPNVELRTFEVPTGQEAGAARAPARRREGSFLVFVRTKHGADRVARRLVRSGHSATQIHGDRSQAQRNQALRSFARAVTACSWPPTSPPAASTWPTWRTSSTSTCPRWPRTLSTAWAAPAAPRRTASPPPLPARPSATTCARSSARSRST
jgi:ATP-dependent RNA helicase RhlE